MDPSMIFKLMKMKGDFEKNHPKANQFVQSVILTGMPEGTIVEMTVTKPGEEAVTTNIKINANICITATSVNVLFNSFIMHLFLMLYL